MKFKLEVCVEKQLYVAKTSTIKNWDLNICGKFVNLRTKDFLDR